MRPGTQELVSRSVRAAEPTVETVETVETEETVPRHHQIRHHGAQVQLPAGAVRPLLRGGRQQHQAR